MVLDGTAWQEETSGSEEKTEQRMLLKNRSSRSCGHGRGRYSGSSRAGDTFQRQRGKDCG